MVRQIPVLTAAQPDVGQNGEMTTGSSASKAAEVASRVLAGLTSPILGARELCALLDSLGCDLEDPDYRTFAGINSETDALPVGRARQHWAPEALAEMAPDIARAEEWALDFGREAFANVIARFGKTVYPAPCNRRLTDAT